jgi:hypothetical protein
MSKTLISEILCNDAATYNAAAPYGFGTIYNGTLSRVPRGGRVTGARGYSLLSNVAAGGSYLKSYQQVNASATTSAYICGFIKFTSFSTHAGSGERNVIFDLFAALSSGNPTYFDYSGGAGLAVDVSQAGIIKATGNNATGIATSALSLNVWYKFVVEYTNAGGNYCEMFVSMGPADDSGPLMTIAEGVSNASAGGALAYLGISNRGQSGNAVGACYLLSGVRYYTTGTATYAAYTLTADSNVMTTSSAAGMQVGSLVLAIGIPKGTTITNVNGTTITLSANATIAGVKNGYHWPPASADFAGFPTDLLPPPTAAATFWLRGDAAGGGDGSSNDVGHAMTWDEACVAAPYISPSATHNFVNSSDLSAVTPSDFDANTLNYKWAGGLIRINPALDKYALGSNVTGTLGLSLPGASKCRCSRSRPLPPCRSATFGRWLTPSTTWTTCSTRSSTRAGPTPSSGSIT